MYQSNNEEIIEIIEKTPYPTGKEIKEIINKASINEELSLSEIDALLKVWNDDKLFDQIIISAKSIKRKQFGDKVKIYIPVYVSNVCINNCTYCGFRKKNRTLKRKTLSLREWEKEIEYVLDIGHRNIEVVLGYNADLNSNKLADYINIVSHKLKKYGEGSVILMNEPMEVKDYEILKSAGLNEVYCWQETYNIKRYSEIHPQNTHKSIYDYRFAVFDRVLKAGIQRYGMGILFGLFNWEYDVLSLLKHAILLTKEYGTMPYAFGIPRFKKAHGALVQKPFYRVNNRMYRLAVAVYRTVFPMTHIYMNTRENFNLILELLNGGGTEVNTEASTMPGGYTANRLHNGEQFFHYSYSSNDIFKILRSNGFTPTFNEISAKFEVIK